MSKFEVYVKRIQEIEGYITVEAQSEAEALEKAKSFTANLGEWEDAIADVNEEVSWEHEVTLKIPEPPTREELLKRKEELNQRFTRLKSSEATEEDWDEVESLIAEQEYLDIALAECDAPKFIKACNIYAEGAKDFFEAQEFHQKCKEGINEILTAYARDLGIRPRTLTLIILDVANKQGIEISEDAQIAVKALI